MPDLVRFESSREVLAVKNGGVVEIESGGMIRVNGVPFPIQLTAPLKDGDLLAWNAASGKFVNAALFKSQLSLSSQQKTYAVGVFTACVFGALDPTSNSGFTINGPTFDTLTVLHGGMYTVAMQMKPTQHAALWTALAIQMPSGNEYEFSIPPVSVIDLSDNGMGLYLSEQAAFAADATFQVGARGYIADVLAFTSLQMHYLGPLLP